MPLGGVGGFTLRTSPPTLHWLFKALSGKEFFEKSNNREESEKDVKYNKNGEWK